MNLNTAGRVISSKGKVIYSFGTAVVPYKIGESAFEDTYHIGVNLSTGKIDEIKDTYVDTVPLHELEDDQLLRLSENIKHLHALRKNTFTVSAKARSGKDFLSETIKRSFRNKVVNIKALADPIRQVRTVLFGESEGKDRKPLIMIGQGLRREDPNIWIKVWLRTAIEDLGKTSNRGFICQDVRQPNEFTFFQSMGALTVKVEADEEKRLDKIRELDGEEALDKALLNDETESHTGGFKADIIVFNNYDDQFAIDVDDKVVSALIERGW